MMTEIKPEEIAMETELHLDNIVVCGTCDGVYHHDNIDKSHKNNGTIKMRDIFLYNDVGGVVIGVENAGNVMYLMNLDAFEEQEQLKSAEPEEGIVHADNLEIGTRVFVTFGDEYPVKFIGTKIKALCFEGKSKFSVFVLKGGLIFVVWNNMLQVHKFLPPAEDTLGLSLEATKFSAFNAKMECAKLLYSLSHPTAGNLLSENKNIDILLTGYEAVSLYQIPFVSKADSDEDVFPEDGNIHPDDLVPGQKVKVTFGKGAVFEATYIETPDIQDSTGCDMGFLVFNIKGSVYAYVRVDCCKVDSQDQE